MRCIGLVGTHARTNEANVPTNVPTPPLSRTRIPQTAAPCPPPHAVAFNSRTVLDDIVDQGGDAAVEARVTGPLLELRKTVCPQCVPEG